MSLESFKQESDNSIYIFRKSILPLVEWAVGGKLQWIGWQQEAVAVAQAGVSDGMTEGGSPGDREEWSDRLDDLDTVCERKRQR